MDTTETIKSWKWRIVRAGFNQRTFAEKLALTEGALSEILSGRRKPHLTTYDKIEKLLALYDPK